nr:HutD family protein [Steroidobacter agaridevorans]
MSCATPTQATTSRSIAHAGAALTCPASPTVERSIDLNVLRAAAHRRMPWKNGGGETSEIAISPPGATLDSLDWRVSMAVVAQDGPFSIFPDIDRTLCILDGQGMALDFGAAGGTRTVTRDTAPFPFPADLPVQARLLAGTIADLNVMTRRGRYRHSVDRLVVDRHLTLDLRAEESLLFCADGAVSCAIEGESEIQLGARDCVLMQSPPGVLTLSAARSSASVFLIQLYRTIARNASRN